jgi:hypothetical protein
MAAHSASPTFADAPANRHHPDGAWNAYAFLAAIPEVMRSRAVGPVAGFSWGYRLEPAAGGNLRAEQPASR